LAATVIENVLVASGHPAGSARVATVVLDGAGIVTDVEPGGAAGGLVLVPAAVDLHLDNVRERRRPRATVELGIPGVVAALDAECAAAGIGVVCVGARCEEAPGKGVEAGHAVELAGAVERLAPTLACDWRIHARVEVTHDRAVDALVEVLAVSSRVALVSFMEHSAHRTRFASPEAHRRFYAEDWGVPPEQVDEIVSSKDVGSATADDRRRMVASIAVDAGIALASHDDRDPDDVDAAWALGARIAEFPLTLPAARRARELGMTTVLGAPNVVRGRSTSPGNLLAGDAVAAGACDVLCSDYLPGSLVEAALALDADGIRALGSAVDLIGRNPALAIGLDPPAVEVGQPLSASLRTRAPGMPSVGLALWRDGRLRFSRAAALTRSVPSFAAG
jgi:alpha-D-ribose 1-methylphosphonate 5-triphosphate diphosphatase